MKRLTIKRAMLLVALAALSFRAYSCTGTHYAPDFTEAKFASIKIGMTEAEVVKILGQPLDKVRWDNGLDNWVYSGSHIGCSYEMRWLLLKDGVVKTVVKHYYEE